MSTVVYLVGHGRVASSCGFQVPRNITMHWLAREGDVTGGLSRAFLSGRLTQEYGQSPPGTMINEHYLCPDMGWVTEEKIKDFMGRRTHLNESAHPCVLYTRPKCDVPLSSIFTFLLALSKETEWHLYWTCCRGYMETTNLYKTEWKNNRVERIRRPEPRETPMVGSLEQAGQHEIKDASFKTVVLAVKSPQRTLPSIFDSATNAVHEIVFLA